MKPNFLLLLFCSSLQLFAQQNLLLHLPLNGNAQDISTLANSAKVTGTVPCPDRFGNLNSAVRFSAKTDRILIDTAAFKVHDYSATSTSLWFKREAFDFASYNPHLLLIGEFVNYTLTIDAEYSNNIPSPQYKDKLVFYNYSNTDPFDLVVDPRLISDRNWHHLVVILKKAPLSTIEIFIDGTSVGSLPYFANTITSRKISIGNHPFLDWAFIGDLDDVRIYNKALTPAEIFQLSNSSEAIGQSTCVISPNPCNAEMNINFQNISPDALEIYSIDGRLIKATNASNGLNRVQTHDLQNGYYILQIKEQGRPIGFSKFVVLH